MKVVFENATIADAVGKAGRVAPTKGSAFDKAAGIVLQLSEDQTTATIMTTNLDVFYLEVVDAVEIEGNGTWRFPSSLFVGFLSKLPIGSGRTITMEGDAREVSMKSGSIKAKLRCLEIADYPIWEPFDPELLEVVPDLGARLQQVEWAAEKDPNSKIAGVHLTGNVVIATDRIRMASAPCEAEPIYKPITIPAGVLAPVMRTMRDCAIGLDGGMFLIMPDQSTQIKSVTYGHEYPDLERVMRRDFESSFKFSKSELLAMIDRAQVFGGNERMPSLKVIIGKGEAAVMMSDQDQGYLGDVIPVEGASHSRVTFIFTPKNLTEAINAAPSEQCQLFYDTENPGMVRLDGGSGYEAWVMARKNLVKE